MFKKKRNDGTLIADLPAFTRLMPYLMPDKKGSTINFEQDLDVTETVKYVKSINRELIKKREILTLFEVVMCAALRSIVMRPKLNRFISGYRYYQRNQILFNFVAKKELTDEGKEVNVKIAFDPDETLETLARKTKRIIREAISEGGVENEKVVNALMLLPHGLLKFAIAAMSWLDQRNIAIGSLTESDPMWCSLFLANVGSFGLDAPYHHLFERGNCPIFLAVGKVRSVRSPGQDGGVEERKRLTLRYTFDDRIADGVYMGRALDLVRDFIEHPEALSRPPDLGQELLKELKLRSDS